MEILDLEQEEIRAKKPNKRGKRRDLFIRKVMTLPFRSGKRFLRVSIDSHLGLVMLILSVKPLWK